MSKPTSLRNERPRFSVNHRKLEPMLVEADRNKRKPEGKKSRRTPGSMVRMRQGD